MAVLRNSFLTLIPKFIFSQNLRPKSGGKRPGPFLARKKYLSFFFCFIGSCLRFQFIRRKRGLCSTC